MNTNTQRDHDPEPIFASSQAMDRRLIALAVLGLSSCGSPWTECTFMAPEDRDECYAAMAAETGDDENDMYCGHRGRTALGCA